MSVVILLLLIVILWQYLRLRGHSRQLDYIHTKLTSIVDRGSHERLLLFNSNPHLQTLLTDLNRLLDVNHKGAVELAKLEKSMRSMLANISHDLKTPLTVVLGYIETILHDGNITEEEQGHILRMIHAKAEEVIRLMNSFLIWPSWSPGISRSRCRGWTWARSAGGTFFPFTIS